MNNLPVKIEVEEQLEGWAPHFTIGVQGFTLKPVESKENAEWFARQLQTAFENYTILLLEQNK